MSPPASRDEANRRPVQPKIDERLFDARIILIHGEITPKLAEAVTAKLLAMSSVSDDDITIFVHSEGGHVESADAIHDMIAFIRPRVKMVGTGWVASGGAHVYLSVPRKDRFCLPNTRFMLHQPLGGVAGQASDVRIEATELLKARERLNRIIAEQTGQPIERVAKDTDRNFWMSAEEARDYGMVGKIIASIGEL
ncbi:MAG: ATP-dependent Clp protease proteolytic subunit [Deltaproteobacteria bacterium]|nr:MAG: ATP-dependent Clp protease proteolytic subunit [Deltaproteobacteria bacterium]